MSLRKLSRAAALLAAALLLALPASGCGGDDGVGKTSPVRGKVTLDGEPLVSKPATVGFKPDASKGNTTTFEPAASVDSSGNYTLLTKKRSGAPAGWYKVVVTATGMASEPPDPKQPVTKRPVPKSLVPGKYGQASTTPLLVEVVASPGDGAYDLKLSWK